MKKIFFILLFILFSIFIASQQRIGLVLSGGAARGIAHIGVLKALEEYNIPVDAVGGTSMGAIIGGLWAAGYSAAEIESIFLNTKILDLFINNPFSRNLPAYMRLQKEQSIFNIDFFKGNLKLPEATIDDRFINLTIERLFYPIDYAIKGDFQKLWKPFLCIASDLTNNKLVVFTKGKLTKSIRASMAIPLVFKPVITDTSILVDGGLYNNLPVKITKDTFNLDYIITVNVIKSKRYYKKDNINILEIGLTLIDYIMASIDEDTIKQYGCYINPPLENFMGYEFQRAKELIDIAYKETLKYIPKLQEDINRREYYNTEINRKPSELNDFKQLIIDTIIMENMNKFHYTIANNVLNMKKNDTFSIDKFQNGIMQLYALNIYDNIKMELQSNDNRTIKIKIKEDINRTWKFGLGGYYGNTAGMNIYGIINNSNIFNMALSTNINMYLGEHKKGIDLNIYSPPIFISKVFIYFNSSYINKKYYSIWAQTFGYFSNMNLLILAGNNYTHNGIISIFTSYKNKTHSSQQLKKIMGGFYYTYDNLKSRDNILSGQQSHIVFSMNIPRLNVSQYNSNSYSINNIYMKLYAYYTAYFNINSISIGFSISSGYLNTLNNMQEIPLLIQNDMFMLRPNYSLYFKYDDNLLTNYYIKTGFYLHYKINNLFGLSSKSNVYILESTYNQSATKMLLSSQLYLNFKLFSSKLFAGFEILHTDNMYTIYSFNIYWGIIGFESKNILIDF